MSEDDELAKLREATDTGTRANQRGPDESQQQLEDAIGTALNAIESGKSKTLSVRDEHIAAILYGLDDAEQFDEVGAALREELGRDKGESVDRSEFLRLAIRLGLREAVPEVLEAAKNAQMKRMEHKF